jgi:hypothetical protein
MKKNVLILLITIITKTVVAQNGLEGLIVEKYYKSNGIDTSVNDVGGKLPVGSTTYRFYLDLLPQYKFQAVYGLPGHELRIETTTLFFNNEDRGDITPSYSKNNAKDNTVMLDSWLSAGAACVGNFGVLKTEDNDSAATVVNAETPQVLQNDDVSCGIPIKTQDGLQTGTPGVFGKIGIDTEIEVFGSQNDGTNGPVFSTTNGSWYCLGGSTGADSTTNKILIAQITTNGNLKYKFNVQIGTPTGGVENYVAESLAGDTSSILLPALNDSIMIATSLVEKTIFEKGMGIEIFPNPANDDLITIKPKYRSIDQSCLINLYDSRGLLIEQKKLSGLSKDGYKYSIQGLNSGIYLIQVEDSNHSFSKKLIVNH